MRVVHLTSVHDWRDPRIARKMLPSLVVAGHEVTLVACTDESDQVVEGWRLRSVSPHGSRAHRVMRVYKAARSLDADIYHLHDPELLPLVSRIGKSGARVIYDMHENYESKGPVVGRLIRNVERRAFKKVNHVIVAESSYRKFVPAGVAVTEVLNYHKELVRGEERILGRADEPVQIVYTGVQSRTRGLFKVLSLAERARQENRNMHFTLAGICHNRADRKKAEAFIAKKGLGKLVNLVGWDRYVDASTLSEVRSEAHIGLVLLQHHDNYTGTIPTKFYEYMAAGLPFVASDFPLWSDFLKENECGVAVSPEDIEGIWDQLLRLAGDDSEYTGMSRKALDAAPRYHWREVEPRLLGVYGALERV